MRPIWKGLISFGLVNIPVRMYSTRNPEQRYDFHFLHAPDAARIRYAKICKAEEKEVPKEEIVRGFTLEDGSYVVLTPEDFERANVEKTNKIEVLHFSRTDDIESPFFEEPYYLEPQKDATDAFALFREALLESQSVGIVRYVLHTREHIGVLMIWKGTLVVNQIRFATDVREPEGILIPKQSADEEGKEMALELIHKLTKPFVVSEYRDRYHEELKKVIAEKAAGKTLAPVEEDRPRATPAMDLMAALKRSLAQAHVA